MIAALGGKLKDMGGGVQAPITKFPNFEQLEAAGQDKLPPGYEKLAGLIQHIVRERIPAPELNPPFAGPSPSL
jgi:hypothetical protein